MSVPRLGEFEKTETHQCLIKNCQNRDLVKNPTFVITLFWRVITKGCGELMERFAF